jgi:hypothetical protein
MRARTISMCLTVLFACGMATAGALAQTSGTAVDTRRDCQTVRTCRFERGGSYRGCLSSYTCRVCRLVKARCEVGGRAQVCHEMRCGWGG